MIRYKDPKGGLEIEKYDSTEKPSTQAKKKMTQKVKPVAETKLSGKDIVDTMQSYQLPTLTVNSTENGGANCLICGAKTAFDNRHICLVCWKKYKEDMFDALKQAVEDVDISIE